MDFCQICVITDMNELSYEQEDCAELTFVDAGLSEYNDNDYSMKVTE